MIGRWNLLACACVVVLAACSSDETPAASSTSSTSSGGSSSGSTSSSGGSSSSSSSGGTDAGTDSGAAGIGPAGGTVTHPSGAKLVVPAGALSTTVAITIKEEATPAALADLTKRWITKAYVFEPSGTTFSQPVTLTLPYDEGLMPTNPLAAQLVTSTDGSPGTYTNLGTTTRDATAKTLSATMSSFSVKAGYVSCGAEVPATCQLPL